MWERKLFGSEELITNFINTNLEEIESVQNQWSTRYVDNASIKE